MIATLLVLIQSAFLVCELVKLLKVFQATLMEHMGAVEQVGLLVRHELVVANGA